MVNFNDPAVIAKDSGAYTVYFSRSALQLKKPTGLSFLRGDGQAVAHRRRSLYVSFLKRSGFCLSQYNPRLLDPSWEFFTTLDYEWNVIRGRLPYRWTIWVRSGPPFLFPLRGVLVPQTDLLVRF